MTRVKPRTASELSLRVQVIAPNALGATAIAALGARGIAARSVEPDAIVDGGILAWAFDAMPSLATTVDLAVTCRATALAGRPVCILVPEPRGSGRAMIERHAAIAYLRTHGAAIGHDIDAWLESIVCLVSFGVPSGPRAAIIAPEGSWLQSQAITVANDRVGSGGRAPVIGGGDEPTDVVLYDPVLEPPDTLLAIPVIARGELAGDVPALFGLRAALGAVELLGRTAERVALGVGPAPREATAELAIDRERLDRELAKQRERRPRRISDHEAKVLLSAYRVEITRQAVAQTPSAAVNIARRAGYPVEVKPWGDEVPPEPACGVEHAGSDAVVRQTFAAFASKHAGEASTFAVIVRETPPQGREVAVSLLHLPSVGWTIVIDASGGRIAAAPCPLRLADAEALAAAVVASRAGDPEPDRVGLANLLRRASHLVVDLDRYFVKLEMPRVVVGGRGVRTLVVDAYAELV